MSASESNAAKPGRGEAAITDPPPPLAACGFFALYVALAYACDKFGVETLLASLLRVPAGGVRVLRRSVYLSFP